MLHREGLDSSSLIILKMSAKPEQNYSSRQSQILLAPLIDAERNP
mgnify:CR=1 FL=1